MDEDAVRRLLADETKKLDEKYQAELEIQRERSNQLAKELQRAKAENLPQFRNPDDIHKHPGLYNQFLFISEQRRDLEKISVTMATYDSDDDRDIKEVKRMLKLANRKCDIRLAAIRAAVSAKTNKKTEMVSKYEEALLQRVNDTTGKFATGEKSFAMVQPDIAETIDKKLSDLEEKTKASDRQGRGGFGGGGRGAGNGRGGRGAGRWGGRGGGRGGVPAADN